MSTLSLFKRVPVRVTMAAMLGMIVVPTLMPAQPASASTCLLSGLQSVTGCTAAAPAADPTPTSTPTSTPASTSQKPATTTTITAGHAVNVPAGDYLLTIKGLKATSTKVGRIDQQLGGVGTKLRTADVRATTTPSTATSDVRVTGVTDVFTVSIPSATWTSITLTSTSWSYLTRGTAITSPASANVQWHGVNTVSDMSTSDFDTMASQYGNIRIARLMVEERCWDPFFTSLRTRTDCVDPKAYQSSIAADVARITANGEVALIVPVNSGRDGAGWTPSAQADDYGPDQHTLAMWHQFTKLWGSNPQVVFETYNEPKMTDANLWLNGGSVTMGGTTWTLPGVQQITNQIRSDGASNLILVEGMSWGADLHSVEQAPVLGTNIAYSFHAYRDPDTSGTYPDTLDTLVAPLLAADGLYAYAGMLSEFGTTQSDTLLNTNASKYLKSTIYWAQNHAVGWVSWGWYPSSWDTFGLLSSYNALKVNSKGKTVTDLL